MPVLGEVMTHITHPVADVYIDGTSAIGDVPPCRLPADRMFTLVFGARDGAAYGTSFFPYVPSEESVMYLL